MSREPTALPIERRALYEAVADELRRRIYADRLPPGSAIDERALCAELGVSRTPLREAIKVLAREGLVELVPGRGAHVRRLDPEELDALFPVVAVLEGLAAAEAARRCGPRELERLERLHADLEHHAAAGDVQSPAARPPSPAHAPRTPVRLAQRAPCADGGAARARRARGRAPHARSPPGPACGPCFPPRGRAPSGGSRPRWRRALVNENKNRNRNRNPVGRAPRAGLRALAALALALAAATAQAERVLRASHQWPGGKGDIRDEMVQIIAREVNAAGVGLRVQVYPGKSLYKPKEQWGAMVKGRRRAWWCSPTPGSRAVSCRRSAACCGRATCAASASAPPARPSTRCSPPPGPRSTRCRARRSTRPCRRACWTGPTPAPPA